jgi:hypothetical protein
MNNADIFSRELIEESKCFLEKAKKETGNEAKTAYLHASLFIAFSALEAHLNSIAEDFLGRKDLAVLEKSILFEKQITFEAGEFKLTEQLKMYRLEDRIEFIIRKFSRKPINKNEIWWGKIKQGIHIRNKLTHPRGKEVINDSMVENSIQAILDTLNIIYKAVYKVNYPLRKRGMVSSMNF